MRYTSVESEIAIFIVVYSRRPLLLFIAWRREDDLSESLWEIIAFNGEERARE